MYFINVEFNDAHVTFICKTNGVIFFLGKFNFYYGLDKKNRQIRKGLALFSINSINCYSSYLKLTGNEPDRIILETAFSSLEIKIAKFL